MKYDRLMGSNRSIELMDKIQKSESNSTNFTKSLNGHSNFRRTEDPNVMEFNPMGFRNLRNSAITTIPQLIEYLKSNAPKDLIFNFIGNPLPKSLMTGRPSRPYELNILITNDRSTILNVLNSKDIINRKTVYDSNKNHNRVRGTISSLIAPPRMIMGDWSTWGKVYLLEYQNINDKQLELVFVRYTDPKRLREFRSGN